MSYEDLTLEAVEGLASKLTQETQETQEKLARLIRAYARILAAREPKRFNRCATVYQDEDGHWDNSFPPDQVYAQRTGPLSLTLWDASIDTRATTSGYYHEFTVYSEEPGLSVGPDGTFYRSEVTGTGSVGQFAAYPGRHGVECELTYEEVGGGELSVPELQRAELMLRAMAFPAAATKQVKQEAR